MTLVDDFQLAPVTRDSVIQKVADAICRLIAAQHLEPGDPLPTETALSEMLAVSRNSLRESMRLLHALGFIEKRPGRGVVVKASLDRPQSIADSEVLVALPTAVEVRQSIETKCVELATQLRTDDDLRRLQESLVTFENAIAKGDAFSAVQAHLSFHDAVVMCARNKFLTAMYHQVRFMIADIGAMGAKELLLERKHFDAHWQIYSAINDRNTRVVSAAIKTHNRIAGPLRKAVIENAVVSSKTP